jgi:hypothetical protein
MSTKKKIDYKAILILPEANKLKLHEIKVLGRWLKDLSRDFSDEYSRMNNFSSRFTARFMK